VIRRLSATIGEMLATPDAKAKVKLLAAEAAYADDETFAAFLASESARWKEALAAMPASN
jgi:tripartite-type tricarboxylate transporter receptor subunit TctC